MRGKEGNSGKSAVERLTDWITLDAAVHQYIASVDGLINQLFRGAFKGAVIADKLKVQTPHYCTFDGADCARGLIFQM